MSPWIMVAICYLSALLLIVCLHQERIYRVMSGFLALLGTYKLIDALTDERLSFSWVIWVKRAVLLAMIIYAGVYAWKLTRQKGDESAE